MNIKGKLVTLRAIEESDLPQLDAWSNDPELGNLLVGWHLPYSLRSTEAWFQNLNGDPLNMRFAIQVETEGLIGTANLVDVNWKDGHAFHGMMIGNPQARGRGYGRDTILTICRYAFEELRLARLDGGMIESNAASLKTYVDRCGWQIEGRRPQWFFRNGKHWDLVLVGTTRSNYHDYIKKHPYWTTAE